MLRIIGGEKRGRKLELPPGGGVRPTTDRAREAIFNMLRLLVPGRPVFDLFAGSGALGLESLSRGASQATFVESEPRVATVLRRNVSHVGYEHCCRIVTADVFRWVERVQNWPASPAIVLIAPPYAYFESRIEELQSLWKTLVDRLADDTAIVIQALQKFRIDLLPAGHDWEMRRYGQTQIVIGQTQKPNATETPSVVTKDTTSEVHASSDRAD